MTQINIIGRMGSKFGCFQIYFKNNLELIFWKDWGRLDWWGSSWINRSSFVVVSGNYRTYSCINVKDIFPPNRVWMWVYCFYVIWSWIHFYSLLLCCCLNFWFLNDILFLSLEYFGLNCSLDFYYNSTNNVHMYC